MDGFARDFITNINLIGAPFAAASGYVVSVVTARLRGRSTPFGGSAWATTLPRSLTARGSQHPPYKADPMPRFVIAAGLFVVLAWATAGPTQAASEQDLFDGIAEELLQRLTDPRAGVAAMRVAIWPFDEETSPVSPELGREYNGRLLAKLLERARNNTDRPQIRLSSAKSSAPSSTKFAKPACLTTLAILLRPCSRVRRLTSSSLGGCGRFQLAQPT